MNSDRDDRTTSPTYAAVAASLSGWRRPLAWFEWPARWVLAWFWRWAFVRIIVAVYVTLLLPSGVAWFTIDSAIKSAEHAIQRPE